MKQLPRYVVLTKEVGETPLQVQERWRKENGVADNVSLAYAGRLDPMASGKLLILIGDECKKQDDYLGLDKEYEFEVLFGCSSDSGDVLGLVSGAERATSVSLDTLRTTARTLIGPIEVPYPVFSSKPVDGKPLFLWKLEDRLSEIEIPTRASEIYRLTCHGTRTMDAKELEKTIRSKVDSLPEVVEESKRLGADFRREEIRAAWDAFFRDTTESAFQIATFRCICSSGTYMRTLAEHIGRQIGAPALAFSIRRTAIGKYQKFGLLGFWRRRL